MWAMLFFDEADGFPDREEEKARKEREAALAVQEIERQQEMERMKVVRVSSCPHQFLCALTDD